MKQIAIIAGHNGPKTGASSKYLDEGTETLVLRDLVQLKLLNDFGYRLPIVDHESDELKQVIASMKKQVAKDAILVDIHFNACNGKANGTEVFEPTKASVIEHKLAIHLLNDITDILGTASRGVKKEGQSQHSKLGMFTIPCETVLIEVCFLDNEDDVKKYLLKREEVALAIAKRLSDFANSIYD